MKSPHLGSTRAMLTLFVDWLTEGSTGLQVARHSLSYIQEIGNGWFGQVRFVSF